MFLITAIVLFCAVSMSCSIRCTPDQLGLPVPIDICDRTKCLEIPLEQLRNLGDLRAYTWNIGKRFYTDYCPLTLDIEILGNADNSVNYTERGTYRSGLNCSNVTNYVAKFNSPTYLVNGKFKYLRTIQGGQTWEHCYKLFVPGGPFVDARCRIDPPPSNGQTTARIVSFRPVHGNCRKDERILESFFQDYQVDWQEIRVDCF